MRTRSCALVLLATSLKLFVLGEKLPASFKLCKRNADLNNCLQIAIESAIGLLKDDGLPELGIPKLDPVHIPSFTIPASGSFDLEQKYSSMEIYGLSASKVTNVSADLDNYNLYFEAFSPLITMLGNYTMNGRMLLMPFHGEGRSNYTLLNVVMTHNLKGEKMETNGETFLKINEHLLNLSTDKVYIHYDNLFNGNQELSDKMHEIINENSMVIFRDVHELYDQYYGRILKDVDNQLFSRVPMDAIFEK